MSWRRIVFGNASWLFVRHGLTLVWGAVATLYLARVLGTTSFGLLVFAQSIANYVVLLVDNGLQIPGTRAVASQRGSSEIWSILSLRVGLAVGAGTAVGIIVWLWPGGGEARVLVGLSLLWLLPSALHTAWAYQGLERAVFPALAEGVFAVLYVGGLVLFVHEGGDVVRVPLVQTGAGLVASALLVLVIVLLRLDGLKRPHVTLARWRAFLRDGWPLMVGTGISVVQLHAGVVLLGFMAPPEVVGWYGAAQKLLYPLLALTSVMAAGLVPALVRRLATQPATVEDVVRVAMAITVSLTLPLAVGIAVAADSLMATLYGVAYLPGALALRVLAWNVVLLSTTPLFSLLIAHRRDRVVLLTISTGAVTCVLLSLLLIPPYGLLGAAVASLASGIASFLMVCWSVRPMLSRGLECSWLLRPLLASVVMGMVLVVIPASLPISIVLGGATYVVAALVTRTIDLPRVVRLWQQFAIR